MHMIPESKRIAVEKALQSAFGVREPEDMVQLTKGLSSALVFRIKVRGLYYLLRVVTREDAMADPSFYYGCMEIAAERAVAPKVHYLSIEDRVSITDFIIEQPFSLAVAREKMPKAIRDLHALPKFAFRMNYFDSMDRFLKQFSSGGFLPENKMQDLLETFDRVMRVYPRDEQEDWVSSHNDSKPENIVFDGQRPWFIDWEAAFLNDRYLDLAIVGNFLLNNDAEEDAFLEAYFGEVVDDRRRSRYFLMQEILHLYYSVVFTLFDKGEGLILLDQMPTRGFRTFHDAVWNGEVSLADSEAKREYAQVHLDMFRLKAREARFERSLEVLADIP